MHRIRKLPWSPALSLALALLLVAAFETALGAPDNNRLPGYVYEPSDNPLEDVEEALAQAASAGKLAMIVLGAEWCHDSRALGDRFSTPAMQDILEPSYVITFVDVAFLEDRRDVTTRLGYPTVFGTPTVLVIDPLTGEILNYDSVSTWQSAYSVPLEDYETSFNDLVAAWRQGIGDNDAFEPSRALQDFTAVQTQRLADAYGRLGPMLAAYKANTLKSREDFDRLWEDVLAFRTLLQKDLLTLRQKEMEGLTLAPDEWPGYAPFPWERDQAASPGL